MDRFVYSALSVFSLLVAVNFVMQTTYGDFWMQPQNKKTLLGIASYETLVLFVLVVMANVPAYLLQRFGFPKLSRVALLLLLLPIVSLLLISWSFFSHFQRFIGSYAVQMFLQDGGQILSFVKKMPSAVNPAYIVASLCVVVGVLLLVFMQNNIMVWIRSKVAVIGLFIMLASVLGSVVWNHSETVEELYDDQWNARLQRMKDSEFRQVVAKVGPFTEFVGSLSNRFLSADSLFDIDTAKLEKRSNSVVSGSANHIKNYNLVYILVESLRPDSLRAYGGVEKEVMPTVDALSDNAYVLTNAWSQASHSNYADVAALSGQYPLRSMDIHFYPLKPEYPKSLPYDVLSEYGYQVGLFSSQNEKWGRMDNYLMSDSIDVFSHVGSTSNQEDVGYNGIQVLDRSDGKKEISYSDFMYQDGGNAIERLDGETTDIALEWVAKVQPEVPVFMYFNFQASHSPFNAMPENYSRTFLSNDDPDADKIKEGKLAGSNRASVYKSYLDSLHYVDQNIARVVDHMKETGRHKNTIYIVSADTSMRVTNNLIGNGADLFPDVLKIPVVMSAPGIVGTKIIDQPVEQIDIMPTALSFIGVGPHPASQGINFLIDSSYERVVYAVAQTPIAHEYSAIYKDWQLVHDFNTDELRVSYIGGPVENKKDAELSPEKVDWLSQKLHLWRTAQIGYYSNSEAQMEFYPPKFWQPQWNDIPANSTPLLTENSED